jgi:hypothetical protein
MENIIRVIKKNDGGCPGEKETSRRRHLSDDRETAYVVLCGGLPKGGALERRR